MNFQYVPLDIVVMEDDNWCQTLGWFTGVHFPEINPYDINNMKFDLNVSIMVRFIASG